MCVRGSGGAQVSNGYIAASWKVAEEVVISFYTGSTLVTQVYYICNI